MLEMKPLSRTRSLKNSQCRWGNQDRGLSPRWSKKLSLNLGYLRLNFVNLSSQVSPNDGMDSVSCECQQNTEPRNPLLMIVKRDVVRMQSEHQQPSASWI